MTVVVLVKVTAAQPGIAACTVTVLEALGKEDTGKFNVTGVPVLVTAKPTAFAPTKAW
jgi:hypothetical protein